MARSSDDLIRQLRGPGPKNKARVREWRWALAPARPTPNRVYKEITMPGWLYDRLFFRALLTGLTVEEVMLHDLLKTDIPDPDRGEQNTWLVSNDPENPWL